MMPMLRREPLRKFLYTIVSLILLAAAVLFALRIYAEELTEIALVPTAEFAEQDPLASNAYQDSDMWFSRPGLGVQNDPARWQPVDMALEDDDSPQPTLSPALPSAEPTPAASEIASEPAQSSAISATPAEPAAPRFAVFFVHPTSYLERANWNAPLTHDESQRRARLMVRGMASAFNQASEIWVPRYRQATFGAFLTDAPAAQMAIDAAYADIEQAFAFFISSVDPDLPIVLAGHSQGALHVTRLLREHVKGTPLAARVAMVYPIGWPISVEHDLPMLGMPACATPNQGGCIVSWASFSDPAEPGQFLRRYAATPGEDGQPRGASPILCVNPLSGMLGGEADMAANLGTLVPNDDLTSGELVLGAVPARCDAATGLLMIGDPPDLGQYVLPGGNYHVYDIPLFWRNLQTDVVRRVSAWTANRP